MSMKTNPLEFSGKGSLGHTGSGGQSGDGQILIHNGEVAIQGGTPTVQNRGDRLLREIRDQSRDGGTRVDSGDALNWHNDRTDIVEVAP